MRAPPGGQLQEALVGAEPLDQPLAVVEPVHADDQVAVEQALAQPLGLGGVCAVSAGERGERLGVDADRESGGQAVRP